MINTDHPAPESLVRKEFQSRLATIDTDPSQLQALIGELYRDRRTRENPQILYSAATHLAATVHLERRQENGRIMLPEQQEAGRAFGAYAQLLSMLALEKEVAFASRTSDKIVMRLAGAREELAFHASLTYATAHGADFVARPTPAIVDFRGADEASDIQIFFEGAVEPDLEIQVKTQIEGYEYHPRIAILNLAVALKSVEKAVQLRGVLKSIGDQTDGSAEAINLPKKEHEIVMNGAAAIMDATFDWDASKA